MNEIQAVDYSPQQIQLIKNQIMPKANDGDLALFVQVCKKTGLDPFTRQIYAMSRRSKNERGEWVEKWTYQVSIDGFRLIAARTGEYEGQTEPQWCGDDGKWLTVWLEEKAPRAARVGVYRKGFREPCYAVARFDTYAQYTRDDKLTQFWANMPELMISKVAESLALRKAFPNELSGLYTPEEMGAAKDDESSRETAKTQGYKQETKTTENFIKAQHKTQLAAPESSAIENEEVLDPSLVIIPGAFKGRAIEHLEKTSCDHVLNSFAKLFKEDQAKYSTEPYKVMVANVRQRRSELETPQGDFAKFNQPTSVIQPRVQ